MSPAAAAERRRLERFSLDVPAVISTRGPHIGRHHRFTAHTRDVSANGAFIYLDQAPGVGTRVRVEMEFTIDSLPELLNVPEHVHIKVNGRVIRRNSEGVGVQFDDQLKIEQPGRPGEVKTHEPQLNGEDC